MILNQRSKLYNIEPLGLETGMVESLSSYIVRLAYKHNINVGELVNKLIIPELNKDYLIKSAIYGGDSFFEGAKTINGCMDNSINTVRVLELFTTRNDLSNLTLYRFKRFFSLRNLFNDYLSWCSKCINEWSIENLEIYYPLVWHLKNVEISDKHNCFLLDFCLNCHKKMKFLRRKNIPGYCSNCFIFLGDSNLETEKKEEITDWHRFLSLNICNILKLDFNLIHTEFVIIKQLNFINEKFFGGSVSEMSKFCCIPNSTLWYWIKGINKSTLEGILLICFKLNIEIIDFLLKGEKVDIKTDSINLLFSNNEKLQRVSIPIDFRLIEKKLEGILKLDTPISMTVAANQIGRDRRVLYQKFPEYCKMISKRYKNMTKDKATERINILKKEVLVIFLLLIDDGIFPSRREIEQRLSKRSVFRERVLKEYWKNLLVEHKLI